MYEDYKALLVEKQDRILLIKFNNPKKKNCLNRTAYTELARILRQVAEDETVSLVVFTGVGDYYTAGNDLSAVGTVTDIDLYIKETNQIFYEMVSAMIDCPKITVALVNGPCIGIGTTLAGICDLVWCAEEAYFLTPFTKLGIVPEAGSSYLIPLILGRSKATEMLLFSEKMSAKEAYEFNFASRVFKLSEWDSVVWPQIVAYSKLPIESLLISKRLLRMTEKEALYKALNAESEELAKRFHSEEFFNALLEFSTRKSKL